MTDHVISKMVTLSTFRKPPGAPGESAVTRLSDNMCNSADCQIFYDKITRNFSTFECWFGKKNPKSSALPLKKIVFQEQQNGSRKLSADSIFRLRQFSIS